MSFFIKTMINHDLVHQGQYSPFYLFQFTTQINIQPHIGNMNKQFDKLESYSCDQHNLNL